MTRQSGSHVEPTAAPTPEAHRRFLSLAGLFLSGPTIWIVHFFVVYLVAEWACAATTETRFLSETVVAAFTLIATVAAVAVTAVAGRRAYRRWKRAEGDDFDHELALAGVLLAVFFAVAVLYVGLPAAVLRPC